MRRLSTDTPSATCGKIERSAQGQTTNAIMPWLVKKCAVKRRWTSAGATPARELVRSTR